MRQLSRSPSCDPPPTMLQHYALGRRIGDGGQCQVFIGRHVDTGVYVALKVGHPIEGEDDPDYEVHLTEWASYRRLGAVMNEVQDIQQFGIAEAYGRGLMTCEDGEVRPWISMQLLGCSMEYLIGRHVMRNSSTFFRFANQMLTALQYTHHRGLLHRDVKPGNFCIDVLDKDDSRALAASFVVLVDFGFARQLPSNLVLHAEFGGTPDFASTRSLLSQPTGPSDDIECLGYTLLELWTGKDVPWDVTMQEDGKRYLPHCGWARHELAEFAAKRDAAWKAACAKQLVPSFLQRWVECAKASQPGSVPAYDAEFRALLDTAAGVCGMEE